LTESERPHRGEAALLAGLLAGQTLTEAARNARIAPNTARRILEQPRVRQVLAEARGRAIEDAVTLLASQAVQAARALADLAEHAAQEHVRLAAATRVLELAIKGRDLLDVEQRLAVLEAQVATSTTATGRKAWTTTTRAG
jgi:hypothetical protein